LAFQLVPLSDAADIRNFAFVWFLSFKIVYGPSFKPFCIAKCQHKTTYICLWNYNNSLIIFLCPSAELANCRMAFVEILLCEVTLQFVSTFILG
jgi:hypothetical protein